MSKILINNFRSSGTLTPAQQKAQYGNAIMVLNANNGEVKIKDSRFGINGYNCLEIGNNKNLLPAEVNIINCDFSGTFSNNAIIVFGTQNNAVINIENCHFADISNMLRLSNITDATGVVVNIKDCEIDKWEADPAYTGFLLLQDYTSASIDEFIETNRFGGGKITINVKNLKYKGNVINPSDLSTVIGTKDTNQVAYMWIDKAQGSDRSPAYDADIYPTFNFSE
jgi:hypothetical protein